MLCRFFVFNANSVDSDQMPRSAASKLSLHCLSISLFGDTRLKLVSGKRPFYASLFLYFFCTYFVGTTLAQEIVYLLKTNIDLVTAESVPLDTRFPFLDLHLPQTSNFRGLWYIEEQTGPRLIKSHLHRHILPQRLFQGQCKVCLQWTVFPASILKAISDCYRPDRNPVGLITVIDLSRILKLDFLSLSIEFSWNFRDTFLSKLSWMKSVEGNGRRHLRSRYQVWNFIGFTLFLLLFFFFFFFFYYYLLGISLLHAKRYIYTRTIGLDFNQIECLRFYEVP